MVMKTAHIINAIRSLLRITNHNRTLMLLWASLFILFFKSIQSQIAVYFEHNLLDTQFTNTLLPLKFTTSDQPKPNLLISPRNNLMFSLMFKSKIVFYYENSRMLLI